MSEQSDTDRENELWDKAFDSPQHSLREGYWTVRACLRSIYEDLRSGIEGQRGGRDE